MAWNFSDYSGNDDAPSLPLLLSERSQQLLLAVLKSMDSRFVWNNYDIYFDDIEAALAEAYTELVTPSMPDFTPIGTIAHYPDDTLPDKWLLANGDFILQADYPDLYAICGSKFGTPSAGRFYIPDLIGRFAHGASDNTQVGFEGGAETHTLTIAEMPVHNHTVSKGNGIGNSSTTVVEGDNVAPSTATINTGNRGSGDPHNNMPPYLRLIPMIKALP